MEDEDPRGGRVDPRTLRRLIDESTSAPGSGAGSAPSEIALRNLAATLNAAATAAPCPPFRQSVHEVEAEFAYECAQRFGPEPARGPRPGRGQRLRHSRSAVLAALAATVLGAGTTVAAACGALPGVERGTESIPPATDVSSEPARTATPSPFAGGTEAVPGEEDLHSPAATASTVPGPAGPEGPSPAAAPLHERALLAQCQAHARNPYLAPHTLVTAAHGRNRVDTFCSEVLPDSSADGRTPPADRAAAGGHGAGAAAGGTPGAPGGPAAPHAPAATAAPDNGTQGSERQGNGQAGSRQAGGTGNGPQGKPSSG
ncbi:hypothetical protein [Streptomyces sp. TR06-5]|uniref:hypothetical protein n=1 Tax=Streptomyces sp. TR06-5 TaxID=3385976 RepID=UPI0039A12191